MYLLKEYWGIKTKQCNFKIEKITREITWNVFKNVRTFRKCDYKKISVIYQSGI